MFLESIVNHHIYLIYYKTTRNVEEVICLPKLTGFQSEEDVKAQREPFCEIDKRCNYDWAQFELLPTGSIVFEKCGC